MSAFASSAAAVRRGKTEAPPGYERHSVDEYRPAGSPPLGAIWYVDTKTGAATSPEFDEEAAILAAWRLEARMRGDVIKPILKYPGAKWNCAEWIISHFPAHKHYVEPYFGSGAVFFNKSPAAHEVINDLSGDVVNLFRVIRERGEELAAAVEMTPWAREEYERSYELTEDPLERARRLLVRIWQSHAASGAQSAKPSGWFHNGVMERSPYANTIGRLRRLTPLILEVSDRLRDAEINNIPALECVSYYTKDSVLIYADPPYLTATRSKNLYTHEMTDADHAALLDALDAHPGSVVLSGYHCELYDTRLAHWHTREKRVQAEKGNIRTEVLWLNQTCIDRLGYGPLFATAHPSGAALTNTEGD